MRTDSELLQAWAQGDEAAMEVFFRRHVDAAWRLALNHFGNEADADDAVQSGFMHISESPQSFRYGVNARAWVLRIVRNACLKNQRSEHRRQMRQREHGEEQVMSKPTASANDCLGEK